MFTKQIAVFLENKKGRIAEVTRLLMQEGINIRGMMLADTVDFGVLRLIVSDRPRCLAVLKAHDLAAQESDVLAVEIEDKPGGLHRLVEALDQAGVNVEYAYAFFENVGARAIVVFKSDRPERAVEALTKQGISILPDDAIQNL